MLIPEGPPVRNRLPARRQARAAIADGTAKIAFDADGADRRRALRGHVRSTRNGCSTGSPRPASRPPESVMARGRRAKARPRSRTSLRGPPERRRIRQRSCPAPRTPEVIAATASATSSSTPDRNPAKRRSSTRSQAASPQAILLSTHIHLDHAGATGALVQRWPTSRSPSTSAVRGTSPTGGSDSPAPRGSTARTCSGSGVRSCPCPKTGCSSSAGASASTAGRHRPLGASPTRPDTPSTTSATCARTTGPCTPADVAGVRIGDGPIMPPTPPPDIDLGLWRTSIEMIEGWEPQALAITHFGTSHYTLQSTSRTCANLSTWAWPMVTRSGRRGLRTARPGLDQRPRRAAARRRVLPGHAARRALPGLALRLVAAGLKRGLRPSAGALPSGTGCRRWWSFHGSRDRDQASAWSVARYRPKRRSQHVRRGRRWRCRAPSPASRFLPSGYTIADAASTTLAWRSCGVVIGSLRSSIGSSSAIAVSRWRRWSRARRSRASGVPRGYLQKRSVHAHCPPSRAPSCIALFPASIRPDDCCADCGAGAPWISGTAPCGVLSVQCDCLAAFLAVLLSPASAFVGRPVGAGGSGGCGLTPWSWPVWRSPGRAPASPAGSCACFRRGFVASVGSTPSTAVTTTATPAGLPGWARRGVLLPLEGGGIPSSPGWCSMRRVTGFCCARTRCRAMEARRSAADRLVGHQHLTGRMGDPRPLVTATLQSPPASWKNVWRRDRGEGIQPLLAVAGDVMTAIACGRLWKLPAARWASG